jgi:outer membrane lipoprotein SlyB
MHFPIPRLSRALGILIVAGLPFGLAACASGLGGSDVPRSGAGQVNTAERGVIVSAREVRIEGTKTGIGAGAGAIAGGAGGSQIGQGTAAGVAGAVAGAVVGGLVGAAAEEGLTRQTGIEYTIQDDSGRVFTVVQADDIVLAPGQRVLIVYGERVRVVPDTSQPVLP